MSDKSREEIFDQLTPERQELAMITLELLWAHPAPRLPVVGPVTLAESDPTAPGAPDQPEAEPEAPQSVEH